MSNKKPILLTGCTGTGKSKLAIELAKLNDSIIINADSMQVYRCLRILTSRPSDNDINKFPHALYGHIDCHINYSVGEWLREIENLLNYAKDSNLRPIIVGGTGLYFSLLVNGLSNIPTISSHVRGAANQIKKNSPNKFVQDLVRVFRFLLDTRKDISRRVEYDTLRLSVTRTTTKVGFFVCWACADISFLETLSDTVANILQLQSVFSCFF